MRDYADIEKDFPPVVPDVMEDGTRERYVRDILYNKLSTADRHIILLYADCGSLHRLGDRLGVSHMSARKQVVRIRKIIVEEYEKMKDNDTP